MKPTKMQTESQEIQGKSPRKDKCTLSDEALLEKCDEWVSSLAKTGGRSWTLSVPVNFNNDPDMLFSELIRRYKDLTGKTPKNTEWVEYFDGMGAVEK